MVDKFREECGVFGIFGHTEAANLTYLGLYALQHRGQESAGIAASDGALVRHRKAMGYVNEAFDAAALSTLPGYLAMGHVRYSTAGESRLANAQPIVVDSVHGQFGICHNGNLVNAGELRGELVREGAIFQTSSDTEVVVHLFARSREEGSERAIVDAISQVRGAFSFVMMTKDRLIGVRDPNGFRPLVLGRLGDAWVMCSETCALDLIGATYLRDVDPGEFIIISAAGLKSVKPFAPAPQAQCIFEHVYFARPDSYVFGESVNEVRTELGRRLARECPAEADVIVPIPDSGVCAAVGFAEASGVPMRVGLIRNHYVGRTFIEPQQSIRHFGVKVKLNPVRSIIEGKRVVLVDDSIVRGTTSRKIVRMVRGAGAREVHMRISCPPTISPCFYGVDTPQRSELIAATHSLEEIRRYLDADSVGYLSLEGLTACVNGGSSRYCTSCYTGNYPVAFPRDEAAYLQLALKLNSGSGPAEEPALRLSTLETDPVVS
ncbi:MAG: amidophosphoribosyltransferase [Acidobacteria bacterium RIFCSPLOWO2_02_FULL_67_21]|nr:MAG: amidophosphoribosyltransferase [Acidobacteria bacterium RIFCSPLOWO2_02_FULL_67_21]